MLLQRSSGCGAEGVQRRTKDGIAVEGSHCWVKHDRAVSPAMGALSGDRTDDAERHDKQSPWALTAMAGVGPRVGSANIRRRIGGLPTWSRDLRGAWDVWP